MNESKTNLNVKVILSLTLIHFIGDIYCSFINPLLPVFVDKFSLTLAQVGLLAGISRFLAFIVQPSVGYLADRYQTRFFILGGPLLSIVFIPLGGIAPAFWMLLLFVSLGSIGSSMFHPPTAGMVSTYAGRHFGFSMSLFNLGGTMAFGVGPLLITFIVGSYGLKAAPFSMILGLAVMIYLFLTVPSPQGEGLAEFGIVGSLKEVFGSVWKPIALMWLVMVLRSYAGQSFMTFLPIMFSEEGYSLVSIGLIVSTFTVAGAISGLLAGHFSDKIGYKPIFYFSFILTTPSLFLLLFLPRSWVYAGVFLTGFLIMATMPLGVAWAQQLAPRGKSMVSSLMMGLAFGTGGMMAPVTGKLADIYSIRSVLLFIAVLPLLAISLVHLIPEKR
ncbi:MAG: MFS transporter [Deltaproteobacteria bacterium]|nr:MFS transporter [Deltaproteobacteria bacterium]